MVRHNAPHYGDVALIDINNNIRIGVDPQPASDAHRSLTSVFGHHVRGLAFEPSEQTFYLVAFLVYLPVVVPGITAVALGWNHRGEPEIRNQLACFVAFIGPVGYQEPVLGLAADAFE